MEMVDVQSSNIKQIGYDADTKTLGVVFMRDQLYHYYDVPLGVFEEMKDAPSVGKYFHAYVRGSYEYENMGMV